MATANEIFDQELLGDTCIIDTDSRIVIVPENLLPFGVESDEASKVIKFKMENIFEDYTKLSFRINYKNALGVYDMYLVKDVVDKDGTLEFSWIIGRNAAAAKGVLQFVVCVVETDENGEIIYEWNTTIARGPILEGLELEDIDAAYRRDIVSQLKDMFRTDQTFRDALDMFLAEVNANVDSKINNDMAAAISSRTTKYFIGYDANDQFETGLGLKGTKKTIKSGGYNWQDYDYLDVYYSYFGKVEVKRIIPEDGVTFVIRSMNLPNDSNSTAMSFSEFGFKFDGPNIEITFAVKESWDGTSASNAVSTEAIETLEAGYIYKIVCYRDYKELEV